MTAIILGWNPDRWNVWDYEAVLEQVREKGYFPKRWSVGRYRNIPLRSNAWLLLQGESEHGRGLIGHGSVISESYEAEHYANPNDRIRYVDVEFDAMLPLGSQIPYEELSNAAPGVQWKSFRGSGRSIDAAAEKEVQRLWRERVPAPSSDPPTWCREHIRKGLSAELK